MNNTTKALLAAVLIAAVVASAFYISDTDGSDAETVTLTADGLTFELTSDDGANTAKLVGVDSTITELNVPSSVKDENGTVYTVTAVGAIGGTTNNTTLVSAVFPETVVSADANLLRQCTALTKVVLPGVSQIPNYAFYNCSKLSDIQLSDGTTSIGQYAFQRCTKLGDLTIKGEVTDIGFNAFNGAKFDTLVIEIADNTTVGNYVFNNAGNNNSSLSFLGGKVISLGNGALSDSYMTVFDADLYLTSVGNETFKNSNLTSIVIGGNVESIGDSAFENCKKLDNITIDGQPTKIGMSIITNCSSLTELDIDLSKVVSSLTSNAYKFSGLSKLTTPIIFDGTLWYVPQVEEYTVPEGVTTIAGTTQLNTVGAGYSNSVLKKLVISESVSRIGVQAFANCKSLEIVEFLGKNVSFSLIYNGMTAYSYAFQNCTALKSIVLPSELIEIPNGILYGCTALESIVIPDTVTVIGISAFQNSLKNVKSILIPSSVEEIGNYAFCSGRVLWGTNVRATDSSVTSIVFEEGSEVSLGNFAFAYNTKLTELKMPTKLTSLGSDVFKGISLTIVADTGEGKQLLAFPSDGKAEDIPTDIVSIGSYALSGWTGTSITIPSTVTSIGSYAFQGCANITEIIIPASVTSIGANAFAGCSKLTSVTLNEGLQSIGNYVFSACKALTSVTLPTSLSYIGLRAFNSCTSLESAVFLGEDVEFGYGNSKNLSTGVTTYTSNVFQGCTSLKTVTLPSKLTTIPYNMFSGCTSLIGISIPSTVTSIKDYAFQNCSSLEAISLNEGLESIGKYAFFGAFAKVESIAIPSTVTLIEEYAFSTDSASALKSIVFADKSELSIGQFAFASNTNVKSITMPSKILSLGQQAFSGLSMTVIYTEDTSKTVLWVPTGTSVAEIPLDLTAIGDYAFNGWKGTEIAVPSTVVSVGTYAFNNCTALTSVTFGNALKTIGAFAFNGCTALTSVTFGSSIENIGQCAFQNCTSLTSVTIPASVTSIGQKAFFNCSKLTEAVLQSSESSSKDVSFGPYIFQNCKALASITLPAQMTEIPQGMFYGCTSLTTAVMPVSMKSIGASAFQNCTALTSVSGSVSEIISANAFNGCTSLTSVPIGEGTKTIGDYAFSNCTSLTSIVMPSTMVLTGGFAFQNCTSLKDVTFTGLGTGQSIFQGCTSLETFVFKGGYMYISGAGALSKCTSLKSIEIVSGSPGLNLTNLTSVDTLRIHANAHPYIISNVSDKFVGTDDAGTYVKLTYVKADLSETEGKYYTSLNSGAVLPADCVGVDQTVIKKAMENGTVSVSKDNTYLIIENGCFYCGSTLVTVASTVEKITIKDGTSYIGYNSLYHCNRINNVYSPYILLPGSVTTVENLAFVLYNNTSKGYFTPVIFQSLPSMWGTNTIKAYYALGIDVSTAEKTPSGYWYSSDEEYTFFTLSDSEHASVKDLSSDSSKVSFSIGLDAAYAKSKVSVTVGGNPVTAVDGTYTVNAGSRVEISGIEESTFKISVEVPEGLTASLSKYEVAYGNDVSLSISAKSSSYLVSDIIVKIGDTVLSPADDGTYTFTVTGDTVLTVTATVVPVTKKVLFDTAGGSTIDPVEVILGEVLEFPVTVPVKTGYTFYSWYLDSNCTKPAYDTVITEDTTVYARWTDDSLGTYTVTFNADEGLVTAARDGFSVTSGSKVAKGTELVLYYNGGVNHEVTAWYIDGTKTADIGDSITITINADTKIEAVTDYYFGDISNQLSEAKGISSSDNYTTAWALEGTLGYVIVGDYAYIPMSTGHFCKVDIGTGEIVKRYQTNITSGKDWPAAGNGLVLDPQSGIVFDLDLNPVYTVGTTSENAFYNDGCWYVNPAKKLSCYSAVDQDTTQQLNEQVAKWTVTMYGYKDAYTLPTTLGFGENYLVYVGTGTGDDTTGRYIYTLDKETGKQVDSFRMDALTDCYWNYGYIYCAEGMVTVKCQWTTLFGQGPEGTNPVICRVYVDDDGNIDDETAIYIDLELYGYGSSVVILNGLGYLWTTGYFLVIDLSNGVVLAKEKCGSGDQCRTNLTLALGEDGKVYGYNTPYQPNTSQVVRCFTYDIANNDLKTYYLTPTVSMQYCDADFIKVASNGSILIRNDSGVASCIALAVTVTIDYSDGTTEGRTVPIDSTIVDDPSVESYYVNAFTEFDTSTRITKDMTLYAKLKTWYVSDGVLTVTESFEMQDYSKTSAAPWANEEFTSVVFDEGVTYVGAYAFYANVDLESVTLSSTVAKIGAYAFYGCASLTEFVISSEPTVGENAFAKSGLTYHVMYKVDGGRYAKVSYAYGSEIIAPADPVKDGYTFKSWNSLPDTMSLGNISVKAVFSLNEYTITFDTDGGSAVDSITQDYGTAITAPAAPTKTGYTFAGWDSLPKTMPAENVTVKALWTADTHSVTVKYVYADGTEASASATEAVEYNTEYSIESPAIVGYYVDKTVVSGTMGTEDVTVTVTYTKDTFAYTVEGKVSQSGANTVIDIALTRTSGHTDIQNARLLVIAMYEGGIAVNVCPSATLNNGTASEQVTVSSAKLVSVTVQAISGVPSGAYDNYGTYYYDASVSTETASGTDAASETTTEESTVNEEQNPVAEVISANIEKEVVDQIKRMTVRVR